MIKKNPNTFTFRSPDDFKKEIDRMGVDIPFVDNLKEYIPKIKESLVVEGRTVPNRLCIQPIEGCDGLSDGTPGELTFRRYRRFAAGGSGMIWVEATAATPEGRANPRQLWINEKSASAFRELAKVIRGNSADENGKPQNPFVILQLTHSGRYSKPEGKAMPIIVHHSPVLDPTHNLDNSYPLVTDEYLDELQDKFIKAAKLAYECGYDAIDIKSCHGYLLHEILSAHTRQDSKYCGSFDNRTRFLTELIKKIKKETPQLIVTTRLNVYDAYPYPYGWGMKRDGSTDADMDEPVKLIARLRDLGVTMVNVAFGNPYFNPYIERPYDFPIQGFDLPEEHPLKSIERVIRLNGEIAGKFPDMTIVNVGFTWLRDLFPNVSAAILDKGETDIIGVGRTALAYPDYANDLFRLGRLVSKKTCITCSSCTQIMRDGGKSGCVIRDSGVYGPIYYQGRLGNEAFVRQLAQNCRNCWGAACMGGCPAGVDVPAFINAFYEGDISKSYEILKNNNILPETCSYTCPADVQCERNCTVGILNKNAVPVHEIQKYVAVRARKNGWTKVKAGVPNGRRVAVIGFGPAGIACSVHLVENGYSVTVFAASNGIEGCAGGTAAAVIPNERLPHGTIEEEVKAFGLKETGLFEIRNNCPVNEGFNIDDIMKQGYDAIFIGAGLSGNVGLPFEKKPEGVYPALEFLSRVKNGGFKPAISGEGAVIGGGNTAINSTGMVIGGGNTAINSTGMVIGGGNTAMDAAVTLKNTGVRDVYLVYRRSYSELPAWPKEIDKALGSGVHFMILNQPVEYIEKGGKLAGIKLARTQLGKPDSSGRPAPVLLPSSVYDFPVSICIEAIGQKVSPSLMKGLTGVEFENGKVKIIDGRYSTTRADVFAGGDIINGGSTVVQAVKDGLEAAKDICKLISRRI